jgi:hypothetical protein
VTVGRGALEAAVENAHAALRLAQIDLENTVIRALRMGRWGKSASGWASTSRRAASSCSWCRASIGSSPTSAKPRRRRWPLVSRLKSASMRFGGAKLAGHVERIAPAAGNEFSVLRPDNATGNFVKVSQRDRRADPHRSGQPLAQRLRPGTSVEARVNTAQRYRAASVEAAPHPGAALFLGGCAGPTTPIRPGAAVTPPAIWRVQLGPVTPIDKPVVGGIWRPGPDPTGRNGSRQ